MITLATLDRQSILGLIEDALRNIMSHNALWFRAAEQELGLGEALRLDDAVWQRGMPIQAKRLLQRMEAEDHGEVAAFPADWKEAQLTSLLGDLAKNWLAQDGVWFQAVEQSHGMTVAKRFNDRAWETFTVIEATRIMSRLAIPVGSGLHGLDQALRFRLYAHLNVQSIRRIDDKRLIFEMNDCRVQSARKRAGLADYPCKSAGLVEYGNFAKTIDSRLTTRCVCCPPDEHPADVWCAWEFTLP